MRSFTIVSMVLVILLFSGISFAALPIAENVSIAGYQSTDNLSASWDVYDADADDVRNFTVWSLNGSELSALYVPFEGSSNAYNATDYAGGDNGGSSVSGATYNATGGYDGYGAYEFSQNDDVVNLATTNFPDIGTGNYTMMAWIKSAGTQETYATIFSINGYSPGFYVYGTNSLSVYHSGSSISSSNTSISDGNWHHIAYVREGTGTNELKFYLDGEPLGTSIHSNSILSATNLRVGFDSLSHEDYYGSIDDVRFYDYALTAEQVAVIANNESNKIVSSMTADDQNWSICVTPNDGGQDGTSACSSNVTIGQASFTPVSGCQEISSAGEYELTTDLSGANISGTCIKISSDNVTLDCQGNSITENGTAGVTHGILVNGTSNIEILNCSSVDDYDYGVRLIDTDNVTIDPSYFCNGGYGISLDNSNNTNIDDSVACNNSVAGIYVVNSINTSITNSVMYNNTDDFKILRSISSGMPLLMSNVTFDNPTGDRRNYSNIDLNDTLSISNEDYVIDWIASPASAPSGYTTVKDKYINITSSTSMSIDSITWNYLDSETFGFDESSLRVYGHNGAAWSNSGATLNTTANTLELTSVTNEYAYGLFGNQTFYTEDVYGCVEITNPGYYTVQNDITAVVPLSLNQGEVSFGCIIISSDNVTLDCQDYSVSATSTTVAPVAVNGSSSARRNNINVLDCELTQGAYPFYANFMENSTVNNITARDSGEDGIRIYNSFNVTLANSTSYNNSDDGIVVTESRNAHILNNLIHGNKNTGGSIGLRITYPDTFTITDNVFYNNAYDFQVESSTADSSSYNMSSSLFLPPSGTMANYSNISINDSLIANERYYYLNWSQNPGSDPTSILHSVEDKHVNLSMTAGGAFDSSIDSMVWHYLQEDISTDFFHEPSLGIWKYNGSWNDTGATLDSTNNELTLSNHTPGSTYGIYAEYADYEVGGSGMDLDQSRTYVLTDDLVGTGTSASPLSGSASLKITAENVILDCNGHSLTGTAQPSPALYGILAISAHNLTIRNCNVYGYTYGMWLHGTENSTLEDNFGQNPYNSVYVIAGDNNTLIRNGARRTTIGNYAYHISGDFVRMFNNTAYFPYGIYANSGLHGVYGNNTMNYSGSGAGFYPRLSYYNIVENNTFHNQDYGIHSLAGNSNNYTNNTIYDQDEACVNITAYSVSGSLLNRVVENDLSNCGIAGIYLSDQANGNTLINNDISSVSTGILIEDDCNSNVINGHTIDSVTTEGIEIRDSSCYNNQISYNTITGIPTGISILEATGTRAWGNSISGSSTDGIYVWNGNLTNLSDNHMYNNGHDVTFYASSSTPTIFMDRMVFDNPAGNYQNYSNISISDTMSSSSRIYFDWTGNSSAPPFTSFNNKYVNITSDLGTVSIAGLSFHWKDSEEMGYDEANLEIWKYDGTWSKLISSVDLLENNLSTTALVPSGEFAMLEGLGTGCMDITTPSIRSLTFDAYGAPYPVSDINYVDTACIRIRSDNVLFRCNGYSISNTGDLDDAAAIAIYGNTTEDYTNVTIENCDISGYEVGIALHQSAGDIIRNVTITNISGDIAQSYGIWSYNTSDSQFYDLTVTNSSWDGIRTSQGTNNTFYDNIVTDNYRYGIYSFGGSNFSIYDSYLSENGDSGLYLNVPSSSVYNNVLYFNDGTGMTVQSTGNEIYDNVVNSSTSNGFYITGNNNSMTNNSAHNNAGTGFQLSYADHVSISNATSHSNNYGIALNSIYNVTLEDVHLYNNSYDLSTFASSDGDDFYVARNVTFDRDVGDFTRDTHLYINDTFTEFDESYTIDHDSEPGILPGSRSSFDNKYVNITGSIFATVSIDNITWKWEDGEIGSADESEFELWKYNGSWSDTGATLKTNTNSLSLEAMNPESTYGILEDVSGGTTTTIYGCNEINESGTYTLGSAIVASSVLGYDYEAPQGNISPVAVGSAFDLSSACIIINASNVIFDCKGHPIDWDGSAFLSSGAAIAAVPNNNYITIQNCPDIGDFGFGVYLLGNRYTHVENVTVDTSIYGFLSSRTRFSSTDCNNNTYVKVESIDAGYNSPYYQPGAGLFSMGCINTSYINSSAHVAGISGGSDNVSGMRIEDPQNVTASNISLYNNDWDIWARQNSFANSELNLSDIYILPRLGSMVNYSRISIYDEMGTGSPDYYIDHSDGVDLPSWLKSFERKYVDFVYNDEGSAVHYINTTVLHYDQDEVDGEPYNESLLDIYRFDDLLVYGFTVTLNEELDATLDSGANTLTLTDFTPNNLSGFTQTSILGVMEEPIPITGCQNITEPGRYRFVNDISGIQPGRDMCIDIQADDVVLHFDGWDMEGPSGFDVGIQLAGRDNITIKGAGGSGVRGYAHVTGYTLGIWARTSTNVDIDPVYFCDNNIGILINQTNNTLINDTVACNNSEVGIYVLDSDNVTIEDSKAYNNTVDLKVNNTLATPVTLNMLSLIFDRPQGDNTSFTNMTINDSIAAGESYQINWTPTPSPLPSGYSSFKNKFADITNLTSSVSIDEIIWRWNETELTGSDNESAFELWKSNGSWSNTSATLDTGNNTLTLTNMNPASDYGILQASVSTCMLINSSGTYTLTSNVEGAPYSMAGVFGGASNACIGIASANVTFDCDGYNITNNGTSNAAGVIVNSSLTYPDLLYDNITIQNCPSISGYDDGIVLDQVNTTTVSNSTLFNNTNTAIRLNGRTSNPTNRVVIDHVDMHNNSNGFLVDYGSDVNITNSRAWNNSNAGVKLENEYVEIEMNNYTAWDNTYGVHLSGPFSSGTSPWANVYNSELYNNSYGFYGLGTEGPDVPLGNITIANTTFYENTVGIYHGYNTDLIFGFLLETNVLTLDNVTVNSSSSIGASLYKSNVSSNNLVFANNTQDVLFNNSDDFNPMNFSLDMNMTFLNPAATYVNYTNLTLSDVLRNNESYSMTWTSNSSALPSSYNSFEQKFVNITSTLGTPTIETTTWRWTDAEAASYTESNLELWKWNGSWSDAGATLSAGTNTLVLANYDPASDYGILENLPEGCPVLNTSGSYQLTANLAGAPNSVPSGGAACVVISASDVALDCNGYTITGNGTPAGLTYGVYARGPYTNITIENCDVSDYTDASVFLHMVSDSFIINNTAHNSSLHYGFWFNQSFQDNVVANNTAYENDFYGFYSFRDCDRNNYTGNSAYNNSGSTEYWFGGCEYNRVVNNTAPFGTGGTRGFYIDGSLYNNFINNTVANRGPNAFELNLFSTDNNFTNNNVTNVQGAAFYARVGSDNLVFLNNTVQGTSAFNSASGFDIRVDNVLLENNTVHGQPAVLNTYAGAFYFNSADDIVMTNNHVYNSTPALRYRVFNGPWTINVSNLIVDNPLGNFQNYTNLSYNDTHNPVGLANYLINWSDGPGSLPTDYISFENKHLNITSVENNVSFDSIVWHWNDDEVPGYNESEFELWKHNGSWSNTSATLDTGANTLSLTNMNPASEYSILERDVTELSNCPVITAPGTYVMTSDFAGAPNSASELGGGTHLVCVKIASSDVVFDCAGHTMNENSISDSFYTYGVLTNGSASSGVLYNNITVKNCVIEEYYAGAYIRNTRNSTVVNNTIVNSTGQSYFTQYGIRALAFNWTGDAETNNYYAHNTITNISGIGISSSGSGNSTFYNNTIMLIENYGISVIDHLQNITDNLVRDGGTGYSVGFEIQSENATVHNNTAYNISGDGFSGGSGRENTNFTSNHAYNNSGDGFDFSGIHAYLFEENLAHDNGENGFLIWTMVGGSYSKIYNNTAENNTLDGFHLNFEPYNNLEDNYAFNNSNGFVLNASKYNNLTNNIAINNTQSGFLISDDFLWGSYNTSEYNRLIDNNASGNGVAGLSIMSSNHNYVDPSYFCNNTNGLIVFNSTNVTLFDNVLCNNTAYGLNITQSNVTLSENQMYNNGYDFFVEGVSNYNMSGSLFLNPLGTLVNYTNLSINDSVAASGSYTINWTENSSTLPTNYNSFEQKFVNISTVAGTPSIDSLAWQWTDAEAASYTESNLQLWKWNGSWSDTGATLNAGANTLTLTSMNPASDYGILENDTPSSGITECVLIDTAGSYQLSNNLVGAPIDASELVYIDWACIKIDSSDVLLDCNGYNITNNGTLNAGAIVTNATSTLDYNNITLRNCPSISDYEIGVYSQYMNSSVIRNLNVQNSTDGGSGGFGFLMSYSVDTNISDNEISDSGSYGIRLRSGQRNRITDNLIYGSGYTGFEIGSTDGFVINNTAHSNDGGFTFISGGYNLIENNLAYNHSRSGFSTNTDNSLFLNNTAYDNVRDGFAIGGSDNTNFTNCTAYRNAQYGMYTSEADEIRFENFHFYDNGYDLYWYAYGGVEDIYATNLTFDNPVGDFDDYTRLDFNASLDASFDDLEVSFSWTTNSSALPANYTSFEQKFVNITPHYGDISFDEIAWRWYDSEVGFIYNESSFELWKWNGSWSDTGATLDTGENSLSLTNMNPASDYGILQNGTIGQNATLYAAEINETKLGRYNESSYAGNASTAGGNFTYMNLSTGQLSERWAALYGTFDGSILLSDSAGLNNVYSWIWNASAGGVVCVSTNDSLFTFTVFPATASDIDTAWSFAPDSSDSANNTFTQSNCTLDIGTTSVPNATYADTGLDGGYITCAIKTTLAPAKPNLAFCAEIEEDGPIWNGDSGDFEIIVPTPSGVGTTETYYFYVNLD